MAPIDYIGRYMRGWFDFAIADGLHQLAGNEYWINLAENRNMALRDFVRCRPCSVGL